MICSDALIGLLILVSYILRQSAPKSPYLSEPAIALRVIDSDPIVTYHQDRPFQHLNIKSVDFEIVAIGSRICE